VGLLRQFDKLGGKNLEVRYVDVEQFTTEAEEAERFGVNPVRVATEQDGRRGEQEVYLGAVVISSFDKVVVPFFGKGLPIEYELTRSVQTVADDSRYTVGVLQTDADLMGQREWRIVTELKKQYNVESVSPAGPIDPNNFDVLLAAMPSSLLQPEMANLVAYAKTGNPLLVFDDPFPLSFNTGFGVTGAPRQPKPSSGGGGMMGGGSPPPEPKADNGQATSLLQALGVQWGHDQVVFDVSNPHPEFALLPAEYVFVTRGGSNDDSFNSDAIITSGLQEMIMLYAGSIEKSSSSNTDFTPLLQTGRESGMLRWEEFVDEGGFNFFSMQATANPRQDPLRRIDSGAYTLAAQLKSESGESPVNAIFVSDIDMISDFFFEERNLGNLNIAFDNVTFVLNAVDALAGDEAYIELRSRRPKHRTLVRVETKKREFLEEANKAELESDEAANKELEARRTQLSARVKEIEENDSLDPIAKNQMLRQAQEAEQQRLTLAQAKIDQNKNDEIRKIRAKTNIQIRSLESFIRLWAVWLPAVPALAVGLVVFARKLADEKTQVSSKRRRD
jgi:ABC-2 type transport system permease protein